MTGIVKNVILETVQRLAEQKEKNMMQTDAQTVVLLDGDN